MLFPSLDIFLLVDAKRQTRWPEIFVVHLLTCLSCSRGGVVVTDQALTWQLLRSHPQKRHEAAPSKHIRNVRQSILSMQEASKFIEPLRDGRN